MRLIITRHGETEENKKEILQGHMPGTLSETGISQAKKLARRLKNMKIDYIYSSDLARAADTARAIHKYHPDTPLIYTEKLREKNLGPFTGKPWATVVWENMPAEVESNESVQKRVKSLIDSIYEEHPGSTICLVCHAGTKKNIIRAVIGEPKKKFPNPCNTAVTIIDIDEDKNHKIKVLNCIDHLN